MANKTYTISIQADMSKLESALKKSMNILKNLSENAELSPNIDLSKITDEFRKELAILQQQLNSLKLDKINTATIETGPIEKLLEQFKAINNEIDTLNNKMASVDFSSNINNMTSALETLKKSYNDIQSLFGGKNVTKVSNGYSDEIKTQIKQYETLKKLRNGIANEEKIEDLMYSTSSKYKGMDSKSLEAESQKAIRAQSSALKELVAAQNNFQASIKSNSSSGMQKYSQEIVASYEKVINTSKEAGSAISALMDIQKDKTPASITNSFDGIIQNLGKVKNNITKSMNDIKSNIESSGANINPEEMLTKQSASTTSKLKIPVGLELSKSTGNIKEQIDAVLNDVRASVRSKPIEVPITLTSKYRSQAQKEAADPATLQANVQKQADREITFHIKSDIKLVKSDITKNVAEIKDALTKGDFKIPDITMPTNWAEIKKEFQEIKSLRDSVMKTPIKTTDATNVEKSAKTATAQKTTTAKVDTTEVDAKSLETLKESLNSFMNMFKESLSGTMKEQLTSFSTIFGEINTNIKNMSDGSVSSIKNITDSLQELSTIMRQAFDIPTAAELNNQWGDIEKQFKKISSDKGAVDNRKRNIKAQYESMMQDIYTYQSKGGTNQLTDLTTNKATLKKMRESLSGFGTEDTVGAQQLNQALQTLTTTLEQLTASGTKFASSADLIASSIDKIIKAANASGNAKTGVKELTDELKTEGIDKSIKSMEKKIKDYDALQKSVQGSKIDGFQPSVDKLDTEFSNILQKMKTIQAKPIDAITADDLSDLNTYSSQLDGLIGKFDKLSNNPDYDLSNPSGKVVAQNASGMNDNMLKQQISTIMKQEAGVGGKLLGSVVFNNANNEAGIKTFTGSIQTAAGAVKNLKYEVDGTLGTIRQFSTIKTGNIFKDELDKSITSLAKGMNSKFSNLKAIQADLTSDNATGGQKIAKYYEDMNAAFTRAEEIKLKADNILSQDSFTGKDIEELNQYNQALSNLISVTNSIGKNKAYDKTNSKGHVISESILGTTPQEVLDMTNRLAEAQGKITKSFTMTNADGGGISTLRGEVATLNGETVKLVYSWDSAMGTLRQTSTITQQASTGLESFAKGIKGVFTFVGQYFTAYRVISDVGRLVKSGISQVKELDTAFTEMQKVSNASKATLQNFSKESFNIASTISSTGLEIQQSSASWLKLGYSLKQAGELAKNSALYSNVGDMGIDVATEHLLSSVKAFNGEFGSEVEASEAIVDRFNLIGNNYAIDSEGLGSSLERSAAALVAGGNNLNEALGLTTASNLIIQDPEAAGNALKVISLRTRGAKTELEEMGEDTSGLAESSSKLREELLALSGIDITSNGSFKSTYQIFDELSQVWDKISDMSKANILEKLAGKTRASIAAALIENFQTARDVVEDAGGAMGSAAKENEVFSQSIEGHTEQLKSKWQEVWANAINRDVINFFLDLGKAILTVVDTVGALPTALGALSFAGLSSGGGRGRYVSPQ